MVFLVSCLKISASAFRGRINGWRVIILAREGPPRFSTSDHPSDFEDDLCARGLVFMKMVGRTVSLAHRDFPDVAFPNCMLLSEEDLTPHLPVGWKFSGAPMCRIHRDVYMAIRGSSNCVADKCDLLGSSSPDGAYSFSKHIVDALKNPPRPQLKYLQFSVRTSVRENPKGRDISPYGRYPRYTSVCQRGAFPNLRRRPD